MKWLLALVVVVATTGLELGTSGTVVGSVRGIPCFRLAPDQCQKPMAGVNIRLVAEVGGSDTSTKTNEDGSFLVRLRPGKYRIQVESVAGSTILSGPTDLVVLPLTPSHADLLIPSGLR